MVSSIKAEEFFTRLMSDPQNKVCFDCGVEEPNTASTAHGTLICSNCAEEHKRALGNISKVKDLYESTWGLKDFKNMKGNSSLKEFFSKYKMPPNASIRFKYTTKAACFYRKMLKETSKGKTFTEVAPSLTEGLEHSPSFGSEDLATNTSDTIKYSPEATTKGSSGVTYTLKSITNNRFVRTFSRKIWEFLKDLGDAAVICGKETCHTYRERRDAYQQDLL